MLKKRLESYFAEAEKRVFKVTGSPKADEITLTGGVFLDLRSAEVPETALQELNTVISGWGIPSGKAGYSIVFEKNSDFDREEFQLEITEKCGTLTASGTEGFRRGVYFLASQLEYSSGPWLKKGCCRKNQQVKNRLSRCYYGPTHRPPFNIDELMDEVDYYPEPYLNRLAKEGINALWLTVCFPEVTFSYIQEPDQFMEKRLAKLRRTVDQCARYGIRIFVFCIEPHGFVGHSELAEKHPELAGITNWGYEMVGFCPTSDTAQRHLYEQTRNLFARVPGLGGILDITNGEQISSCFFNPIPGYSCPRCEKLTPPQILNNVLRPMVKGMKESAPEAEFISWFYQSSSAKDVKEWVYESAASVPEGVTTLYNFESGIIRKQQGITLHGGDYWNSKTGPSYRFRKLAKKLAKSNARCGAKLQISNGHELATVPVIPVPGLLYHKYKFIVEHHVDTVMYSWYFGSFPGLMNRAAFELGSWDFKRSEKEFLNYLAALEWGEDAPVIAEAWQYFSRGYSHYPLSTEIQYNGPFHHGIVWPLYPEVKFHDLYASWKPLPVSGDSIGKCLGPFSIEELEKQSGLMARNFRKGLDLMLGLKEKYQDDPHLSTEINFAHAVGLLLESGWHIARFYMLRKKLYDGDVRVLKEMEKIIRQEIAATEEMISLCRAEFLIGYHSESENMKFTPEELAARADQLKQVLSSDIPDLRRRLAAGEKPRFPENTLLQECRSGKSHKQDTFDWEMKATKKYLHFKAECRNIKDTVADRIYFIFCDELYSSAPQIVIFSSNGPMPKENRSVQPEKVSVKKHKDGWSAAFSIPRSQLEPKPTFNVFRQYMVNGAEDVDSWCPDPGRISYGAGSAVMHSAAMGRLLPDAEEK